MKEKQQSPISWVFQFAGIHKSMYIGSVILALVGVVFSIAPYFVMADIINRLIGGDRDLKGYLISCAVMAVLWILRVLFHACSTTMSHKATFSVIGTVRKKCLDKLSKMSLGDIQSKQSGELKNILVERIDSIETTLAHILPEFTSNLVGSLCILIYLFFLNWKMALAALIPLPIGFIFFFGMMIGYEPSYKRTVKAVKDLNDSAVEYIGGIEVIKVFGKVKSSYEKFLAAAKEGANSYIDWMRKSNFFFSFMMSIMPATLVSVLPIGGIMMKSGTLSVETFILITILSIGLITPLIICMSYSDDLAKLGTVIGEITSILDSKEMERPEKNIKEPQNYTVDFKDVHFGYDKNEVLHGINLQFQEGKFTALVGPSGSGKSTIAKLLASYFDVNSGSISIGNVDVKDMSADSYYKNIAYVSQNNFLFNDTIRENIRMGNLNATDEDVINAAKSCGCHEFIMGLENGYDTVVGDAGGHLSGGEKQRVSIARAMLKNAPIVILDEATAYTDPENEAIIEESVSNLVKGKTLIIIAHRLSTIINADRIYVINEGRVDSCGKHEELLAQNGLYCRMWKSHISTKDSLEGGKKNV